MFLTFAQPTLAGMYFLMSIVGVSWAVTGWVPFAIIGEVIHTIQAGIETKPEMEDDMPLEVDVQPGIVLGLHNMAIAVPQMVAAVASSVMFWTFQQSGDSEHSIGWVLGISGVSALYAAYLASRVSHDAKFLTP